MVIVTYACLQGDHDECGDHPACSCEHHKFKDAVEVKEGFAWFRKKPVKIQARQLKEPMKVKTLEGTMFGRKGDWLIIGVKGEQYFCKDDIFKETYDRVEV